MTEDDDSSSGSENFTESPRSNHELGHANWDPRLAWRRAASAHASSSSRSAEPTAAECDAMDCTDAPFHHVASIGSEAPACAVAEQISPDDAQSMIQTASHKLTAQIALDAARDGHMQRTAASSSKANPAEDGHSATLPTVADSADLDMYLAESLDSASLGRQPASIDVAEQISPERPG